MTAADSLSARSRTGANTVLKPRAGCEDGGRRRHGGDEVAQTIDEAAFEVDAAEERSGTGAVGFAEEGGDLRGFFDIAAEEDDAAGPDALKPGALFGVERSAADSGDEDLPGLLGELDGAAARHEDASGLAASAAGRRAREGDGGVFWFARGGHGKVILRYLNLR
jgi:hypothetical protein